MRFLVVSGIFPPDIGGPATYVPVVSGALAEAGHQVTVVTVSPISRGDDAGYPFRLIRVRRGLPRLIRRVVTIFHLVRLGHSADVLYVNGVFTEVAMVNFFLRKPRVLKIVGDWAWETATNRGWTEKGFEEFQSDGRGTDSVRVRALKWLRSATTRGADGVITNSRYMAERVSAWGVPRDRLCVVYNSAETVELGRDSPAPAVPLQTRFRAVTACRLVRWKGVDEILRAIADLDDVGLVVVGDGPERPALEALTAALGLQERVFFAGQRSKREAMALMASGDVFVLNSAWESFPHALLEALSLGVRVVATDVGGNAEIVTDERDGRLIPPHDIDGLRKAIEMVLQEAADGIGAKPTPHPEFDRDAMIKKTVAFLVQFGPE